ncbi:MAG: cobalamin biosynthesis protein CobD [Desulfobacteraceae bacterium 4572_123]|nr:MAG: cobalamin biosynthesis protein CobD [Desulfobacteraceae bacterium 4572_123]
MNPIIPLFILPAALVLDMILGDPRCFPHPVRWMGRAIEIFEPCFRKALRNRTLAGGFFAVFLIGSTWLLTFALVSVAGNIAPWAGLLVQIVLIYYCISARSLEKEAMEVARSLRRKDLHRARQQVAMIVGRDVEQLDNGGVARATFETVAENLVDGVISPLFFAALGGAPLAMAYKMINTLDSMVGYKNERYMEFGKAAARIDDAANYIPSRLSVFVIGAAAQILAGNGALAFKTAWQDGAMHSSPNAGYSEAAFAGALRVRLGGPNYYHGRLVEKPYIGHKFGPVGIDHIKKGCELMLISSMLWVCILFVAIIIF